MHVDIDRGVRARGQGGVAGQLLVELDEPCVAIEVEVVPFVKQVALGLLGLAGEMRGHGADQLGDGCGVRFGRSRAVAGKWRSTINHRLISYPPVPDRPGKVRHIFPPRI